MENDTVTENEDHQSLHFKISSGLKSVIGRDLITDDEVAIFELVKNSFDANADEVKVFFSDSSVVVLDNGDGMTLDEIKNKWLFVAYSSKKEKSHKSKSYRQTIENRKNYAGSKGIGRFSSDRLGSTLRMQTKSKLENDNVVHDLVIDWDLFEADEKDGFSNIPVDYSRRNSFFLPSELSAGQWSTAIEIKNTRNEWDREKILRLKSSLAKLINPFGADKDDFKISISSPKEALADQEELENSAEDKEGLTHRIVNGEVGNFIFSTLEEKTTFNEVELTDEGRFIVSTLVDRGEMIYQIKEPNPFPVLYESGFKCRIYYLNQSAKVTFTRRMGLPSVRFGSVFLFRNGFRVYPIGEDGDDWFGIDKRKQQGYARFLGTRDIIGRVDVSGTEDQFKEASSRNQGLVDSSSTRAMQKCFWEYCLKRLERYVVPVTWRDTGEKITDDLSILLTDSGRARVTSALAKLIDSPEIEVLNYSKKLVGLLNERSGQFEESLSDLRTIALKTEDSEFLANLELAEKRFSELKIAESEAKKAAEAERKAKEEAQQRIAAVEKEKDQLALNYKEEIKRNMFLTSLSSLDKEAVVNMHHQITIYAADQRQQIENCIAASQAGEVTHADLVYRLEQIAFTNQKVLSISRLATKANFRLESDKIKENLADYIEQYVGAVAQPFFGTGVKLKVVNKAYLEKSFSPMEISIVIDNLVSNARKSEASEVIFDIAQIDKKTISVNVTDNGKGMSLPLEDFERVFELGFSRTSGSGLGLYHVRQVLGEMKGSIKVIESAKGAQFELRVSQ